MKLGQFHSKPSELGHTSDNLLLLSKHDYLDTGNKQLKAKNF
jgi:hypothetical protein